MAIYHPLPASCLPPEWHLLKPELVWRRDFSPAHCGAKAPPPLNSLTKHHALFTLYFSLPPGVRYILSMSTNLQLVLCSVPNRETAEHIAETLVSEQLAACVNIIPGIVSIYRWKEAIEKDGELLLLIKTTRNMYESLEHRIQALHPYELPEIIAVSIQTGQTDYIKWIENCLITP